MYASFISRWNKPILNVVASSHESTELGKSILNHFEILIDEYDIKYHETVIYDYLLGHYMLSESSYGYKVKRSVEELKKYKRVFLGHQHTPQDMKNAMHIGSCRYISFSEYKDKKRVIILDIETNRIKEVLLMSPIPMRVIGCNYESTEYTFGYLDSLQSCNKVKLIFNDLNSYKSLIHNISKWNKKFIDFKIELNFKVNGTGAKEETTGNFSNDLLKWLDKNKVDMDIKNILKKEVNNVK